MLTDFNIVHSKIFRIKYTGTFYSPLCCCLCVTGCFDNILC